MKSRRRALRLVLLALLLPAGRPLVAQNVTGRVVEAVTDVPVSAASVYLFDRDGDAVAQTLGDSLGRYALRVPEESEYYLSVERFGYERLVTPLLLIGTERSYTLDLEVRPEPIPLDPIDVTVRSEELYRWVQLIIGMNPMSLGGRVLQGRRLEALKLPGRDIVDVLRWANLPVVIRTTIEGVCVQSRGRGCASIFLDGMPLQREFLDTLDPQNIGAVVYLNAIDGQTLFATAQSGHGVVLLYTRTYLMTPAGRRP